ncbi:MAG: hypothetical protein LBT25_11370 [Candidatus Symbiothrix sp.]|jgi:hypothetical protein|nr:hypothetical protein [Candidatus Symbiothrix sp.]
MVTIVFMRCLTSFDMTEQLEKKQGEGSAEASLPRFLPLVTINVLPSL